MYNKGAKLICDKKQNSLFLNYLSLAASRMQAWLQVNMFVLTTSTLDWEVYDESVDEVLSVVDSRSEDTRLLKLSTSPSR